MQQHKRISIIGNAGGGKSILARALSKKAGITLHELDQYLWKGNWESVESAQFLTIHQDIVAQTDWVIDGFGLPESIQPRFDHSTHIILVDLPIWLHYSLAAERQASWKYGEIKHPPGGMKAPPPTRHLFELMWKIHEELMPTVRAQLETARDNGVAVETVTTLERLRTLQFDPLQLFPR